MDRKKRKSIRTCVGCDSKKGKFEMIRFVSSKSGELVADLLQIMDGRGVYICPDSKCFINVSNKKKSPFSWKLKKAIRVYTAEELKKIVYEAMNQLKGREIPIRVMDLIRNCSYMLEEK